MKLTTFTDYSLRVLIYVASKPTGELSTIDEIAQVYRISRNHLTKSVHKLSKLGLIRTTRGRNGGFEICKDPKQINIGWVVRQTEENWDVVECFDPKNFCILNPACRLKGVLARALSAYLDVLDGVTLADITANKRDLVGIFTTN
ncbi:RrF2 family transcriptional regulator [Alicyclobacillus ferrooxydans]|uniref:HTH-type transcriptional regulator NsrR n=1 Tax=Alicyclobacillus ferrooxydans TaxID=471514 RepID=A0A0P9C6T6_9BACL|nr:Rrf2 family transcriptional regulator [Alicyclobacillus ferrooxydans]KPV40857.1 Rrf2 family transcriptional regulator [Alicyclobacillus ferrooxydans]